MRTVRVFGERTQRGGDENYKIYMEQNGGV